MNSAHKLLHAIMAEHATDLSPTLAEREEAFEVLVDEAESFLDLADSEGIIRPGVLRRLYPGRPEWHGASNWRTAAVALEGCTPEAMDEAVRRAGSSR